MKLTIITPHGITYEGEINRFHFPSTTGFMEYLTGHAPMIAEVRKGTIVTDSGEIECGNGVVKIENDEIKVVCE